MSPNPAVLTWPRPVADGGWSPADIPGLYSWWDASDTATITASGGIVTVWADKSGNGYTLTAAGSLTTGAVTIGGLNAIGIAGGAKLEASTASDWTFLHDGTSYIVAAVAQFDASTARSTLWATNRGLATDPGALHYWNTSSSARNMWHRVDNGSSASSYITTANGFLPAATPAALTLLADPDNATASQRATLVRDDGTPVANNTETAATSSAAYRPLAIGGLSGAASNPMTGRIGEFVIVSGADATEANRAALAAYLMDKWAL